MLVAFMARILKADSAAVRTCIDVLNRGGVILYPTDTIYGLGADATNRKAVRRLFGIKERDPKKPVYVAVANLQQAGEIAMLNSRARVLAKKFLPGPLTLILRARNKIPQVTYRGTIGIRMPDNAFALKLLRQFGKPLTATSANISGMAGISEFRKLDKLVLSKVDVALDGAKTRYGKPSTILDVSRYAPRLLREGAVSRRAIESVLKIKLE
jgi:L-threonylcarbamoyladenylate synthase